MWERGAQLACASIARSNLREFDATMDAGLKPLSALGAQDPTIGRYSATSQTQSILIQMRFAHGMTDIVNGRRPASMYNGFLQDWRYGGGDTIQSEFEQAYGAAQ
jgi:hypothetical protein